MYRQNEFMRWQSIYEKIPKKIKESAKEILSSVMQKEILFNFLEFF